MIKRKFRYLALALSFVMAVTSANPIYATEADYQSSISENKMVSVSEDSVTQPLPEKEEEDVNDSGVDVVGDETDDTDKSLEASVDKERMYEPDMIPDTQDYTPDYLTKTVNDDEYIPLTEDAFSKAATLKGIQGNAEAGDHYFMNCLLQTGMQTDGSVGKKQSGYVAHEYKGKTYYFRIPAGIAYETIQYCNENNKTVSIEFLLQYDATKLRLIDPESRVPGFAYYAPNMSTAAVKEEYEAYFDFLAREFSQRHCHIDNWILGNEVNMGNSAIGYHYTGGSKNNWPSKYAKYFKVVHGAVRTYTSASRVSICLDHSWNDNDEGRGISAKNYLNSFAKIVGKSTDWCISYHAYPAVLFETKLWQSSAYAGQKLNPRSGGARFVDGGNLSVMTNYVKKTYGKNHRIMLTEQGFSQAQGQKAQAAAFVITYYAAKFDDMVDCMILHTANEGGNMNFAPSDLYAKCYKKIDNGKSADVKWINKKILPIIGTKDWKTIVPTYKESLLKANITKIRAYVSRLYLYGMGREATEAEITKLANSIKTGKTTAASAAKKIILSSSSPTKKASNEEFVKAAYKGVYGKNPSSSTVRKYAKMLKKKHTRKYVLKQMVDAKKFRTICKSAGMEQGTFKAKK